MGLNVKGFILLETFLRVFLFPIDFSILLI